MLSSSSSSSSPILFYQPPSLPLKLKSVITNDCSLHVVVQFGVKIVVAAAAASSVDVELVFLSVTRCQTLSIRQTQERRFSTTRFESKIE